MQDHYGEAEALLRHCDEHHRLTPAERVARAHVHALLAQADASRAMFEALTLRR
jgi:hypothetical protein